MSPNAVPKRIIMGGFPRVSGDEPDRRRTPRHDRQFSPRERG